MNDREVRGRTADGGKQRRRRKSTGGGWMLYLIAAVYVITLVFVVVQMRAMTADVRALIAKSTADQSSGAAGDLEQDGKDENGLPLICIDAGHGYDDTGAIHANLGGLDEKDINLDIVMRMAELMEELGYPILLIRDSDIIPEDLLPNDEGEYVLDVYRRCEIANEAGGDLYVSVHCNALPSNESVKGMQLYYTAGHTPDNPEFAEKLADGMEAVFGERPKIIANPENDSYVVNRLVEAPSVLVETGFITNADDARLMLSDIWRQQMAEALVRGICEFLENKSQ